MVSILPGTSSFDLPPAESLDPELFDGTHLSTRVRLELLGLLNGFMQPRYRNHEQWLRSWIAGSGASFRWHASETMKDLDILLGVNFIDFRQANPNYAGVSDIETAHHINDQLRSDLWPVTSIWRDKYEVTWYVNPRSWDIRAINPYAAYDLVQDDWTVTPSREAPTVEPQWEGVADSYSMRAAHLVQEYSKALTEVRGAQNPAHRVNAERRFNLAVDQATRMFDTVHEGRRSAFSPVGRGYDDFANFLWQSGKKVGWIPALKQIKEYRTQTQGAVNQQTYGLELPDTDLLVRRAVTRGL